MNKATDISIILDRSASMSMMQQSTIKGFNEFLKEQKEEQGERYLSLIQFNDEIETIISEQNIEKTSELTSEDFIPSGCTALYDAIGSTIKKTKKRLKNVEDREVIIAIITDGYENSSLIYKKNKIKNMIQKRQEKQQWKFVFIGANQDAIYEASQIGIPRDFALTADFNCELESSFQSLNSGINRLSKQTLEPSTNFFSNEDREIQYRKLKKQ